MKKVKRTNRLRTLIDIAVPRGVDFSELLKKADWDEIENAVDLACLEANCKFLDVVTKENGLSILVTLKKLNLDETIDLLEKELNQRVKEVITDLAEWFPEESFFNQLSITSVDADGPASIPGSEVTPNNSSTEEMAAFEAPESVEEPAAFATIEEDTTDED